VLVTSLENLVASLEGPRAIFLFVPNGKPVDNILTMLRTHLKAGDIVADCGNSHYRGSERRQRDFRDTGIDLLGVGISGGPTGALNGPAIMAGGEEIAWAKVQPIFEAVAAKYEGTPCCNLFGKSGAGHFVKMVHNGIEYGAMHLFAELYIYLEKGRGMDSNSIVSIFEQLNKNLTAGYLAEITLELVNTRTEPDGKPLMHIVDDAVEQKGTGRWAIEAALDYGAAIPTIAEAVFARTLSSNTALRRESINISRTAKNRQIGIFDALDEKHLSLAFALALASTYAQGLTLFSAVGDKFGDRLDKSAILRSWRQGCILRGEMVVSLIEAFKIDPQSENVFGLGIFPEMVRTGLQPLRSLVADAILSGIPFVGFASALSYIELLNGGEWPGRLIQMQRDYFGHHGLRDKVTGAAFHGPWHESE
jgi:6-phosphogluconate dehydrogenase